MPAYLLELTPPDGNEANVQSLLPAAGLPIVNHCLDGYNSCIFAYGQTGSGKTHTMMGRLPETDTRVCHPEV
jgi:hypothetical protein